MFSIRTTGLQTTLIEQLNINNILEISEKTPDSLKNRRIVQKTIRNYFNCLNLAVFLQLQQTSLETIKTKRPQTPT